MGTRSIILVTGNQTHYRYGRENGRTTVRLYKHWDGYPSGNLPLLLDATRMAKSFIIDNGERLKFYTNRDRVPHVSEMPAETFAQFVIAASIDWSGAGAEIDEDIHDDKPDTPALYHEKLARKHYGNQGDLEWVYVVDLPKMTVKVYGGSYGEPGKHLRRGLTDPRTYAKHLRDECQSEEEVRISMLMDQLLEAGWDLNPTRPSKEASHA